jgi:hypothetical protein
MEYTVGVFGASVTKQKDGYAYILSEKINIKHDHIFGYGGMHIDDAGICFLDNVVETRSDYCFIDFFSTDYTFTTQLTIDCLDTIVYKFTSNNCKLIFLFLLNGNHIKRLPFYKFVKTYLDAKKLYYIDLNAYLVYSNELCSDYVHTTHFGSEKYAEIIYEQFEKNRDSIKYPIDIVKTKYCDIKQLSVNKTFQDGLQLRVCNAVETCDGKIIGFVLIIGPKSGLIKINNDKCLIWDQWCHYERKHIQLKHIPISDILDITVLQDQIDYSSCRRPILDSEYGAVKELNIIEIYYINNGGELELIENKLGHP